MLVNEIRINPEYSQLTKSDYEKSLKNTSTPKIRKHHTNTRTYLKKISNKFNQSNILMPPNCRYIEKIGNGGHLVVIEEPPALRTIKTDWGVQREIDTLTKQGKIKEWGIDTNLYIGREVRYPLTFTFAFPYVIFINAFDENNNLIAGQVFLRVARLSGMADYLLKTPLMNISDTQYICYGDRVVSNRSLDTAISDIIMKFWSARFNGDYTFNYSSYKSVPYVSSHIEWQYHSQTNPMFIYNVDWIHMPYNLGDTISEFKHRQKLKSSTSLNYTILSSIFAQPMDTGKKEKIPGLRKVKYQNLFYDIAQGMFLDDQFFIHVGDTIKLKNGKMAFVDSFIGFANSTTINYIQLKTETGTKIVLKYTPNSKMSSYITAAFKRERYAENGKLSNGVVIKEDDIIIIDYRKNCNKVYKHVKYIRKTRDGITEAKLGNDFYILENITGEIFNKDKPKWDGIDLKKGNEYIMVTDFSRTAKYRGYHVNYDGLTVNTSGNLVFSFKNIHNKESSPINITYDTSGSSPTSEYKLLEIDKTKVMPPVFRFGRSIISIRQTNDSSATLREDALAWGTINGVTTEYNSRMKKVSIQNIIKYCLLDNGTKFRIESFDMDIEFEIGDKVVASDWKNPVNTLVIKTIQGFKVNEQLGTIDFILADKNNNLSVVEYVNTQETSLVFIGRVRKIVTKFGRISTGTKIIANEKAIPNFPKKDTNIIIGFITDTGGQDPLVLCSNGCTLWYSYMMENFKRIGIKSREWKKHPHVPIDVQKIKFQPGDIIMSRGDYKITSGWLVWTNGQGNHKISNCGNLHNYTDYYHLVDHIKAQSYFDCIPNPRIPAKVLTENGGVIKGWPNFHGLFSINDNVASTKFLNDERSILHVQNSRE